MYIYIAWSIAWSPSQGTNMCYHPKGPTCQPMRLDHYPGTWNLYYLTGLQLPLPPCGHPRGPKPCKCTNNAHQCRYDQCKTLLAPGGLELRSVTKGLKAKLVLTSL